MVDNDETTDSGNDAAELRDTLVRRLVMAGALVALLLGVLAFFDHWGASPEEPDAPVFTEPVPVAPRQEVSQPVTTTESPPEFERGDDMPVAEAPPAPEVEATPTAGYGIAIESPPAAPRPPASRAKPSPVAEETAPLSWDAPTAQPTPAPTPTPQPAASPVKTPASARLFSGFVLQAGVFSNPQLAEELRAKLILSGVPSSVETRVQVGPFSTRQEAEAAQARLKELGIQTILVAPAGRR